jgi:isoleucyl-tRNA synthetase
MALQCVAYRTYSIAGSNPARCRTRRIIIRLRKTVFDPKEGFLKSAKGYPADFIAEGLDQTRGWFYSLLVLGTALFGKAPYKNVIVNGLILAEDGRKMSKKLKNFPEPMEVVEKYGADALRLYLLSSPLLHGEDLRFSEKAVADLGNKVIGRLHNTLVFLETYATQEQGIPGDHILDRWIRARVANTAAEMTDALEAYELDRASRPLFDLVDDLSTWYVRRSRERLKDDAAAAATLRDVLRSCALLFAPFAPFYADYLFRRVKRTGDPTSVHLAAWPEAGKMDDALLKDMQLVRALASDALKLRQDAGIKVRQPLAKLIAPNLPTDSELISILQEEINVKGIVKGETLALDTVLTPELVKEGDERALARAVAEARKTLGLSPKDKAEAVMDAAGEYEVALSTGTERFSLKRDAA